MNRVSCFVFLILLSHLCAADSIAREFEQKFQAIRTMQAKFYQTIYAKRDTSTSSGQMFLARPGRFRWDTTTPMKQLIIADGHQLWIYDEALEQVTVRKQSQTLQSSAGLFLSDHTDHLLSAYQITYKKTKRYDEYDLKSTSSQADFKHVIFQFENTQLKGMTLYDTLGQRTVIRFKQVQTNTPISPQVFKFYPPKGVDVIDEGGHA